MSIPVTDQPPQQSLEEVVTQALRQREVEALIRKFRSMVDDVAEDSAVIRREFGEVGGAKLTVLVFS